MTIESEDKVRESEEHRRGSLKKIFLQFLSNKWDSICTTV